MGRGRPNIKGYKYSKKPVIVEAENSLNELIKQIAQANNLPIKEVSDILQYTYGFIVSKIREGKAEGIRIPYWGSFIVKPKNKLRLEEKKLRDANEKSGTENKGECLLRESGQEESGNNQKETDKEECSNQNKTLP